MTNQQSLDWLKEYFKGNETEQDIEAFETLQELVDKATPKEAFYDTEFFCYCCPTCKKIVEKNKYKYCCSCGRALDWGNNE